MSIMKRFLAAAIVVMGVIVVMSVLIMAGCQTKPLTRIVHVTHVQYLPVPATLLRQCPAADVAKIATNGELAQALIADQASLETCNAQLRAIQSLKAPAPGT